MKRIFPATLAFRSLAPILLVSCICLPAVAQEEQTPINIERAKTTKDATPPVITFNNYGFTDLKVENTFGATEKFYNATGNPTVPGDLKTVVINNEWATLKATPCTDGTLTTCANYAKLLPNGPSISVDTKQYVLQQFHFHTPSEHTVDGKRPAMELHFVHLLNNGCAADDHRPGAVVGVFIEESTTPDPEITKFFNTLSASWPANNAAKAQYVRTNLAALLPAGKFKWRYDGGLTAPTGAGLCGVVIPESIPGGGSVTQQLVSGVFPEVVHWFLYEQSLKLTSGQIAQFKALFPEGNARAVKENINPVYETPAPPSQAPANPTKAVANPKNASVTGAIALDGSASVASDGKALTYSWKVAPGGKNASILNANSVNPLVQFAEGYGYYNIELTVTDSTGAQAKDTTSILYVGR